MVINIDNLGLCIGLGCMTVIASCADSIINSLKDVIHESIRWIIVYIIIIYRYPCRDSETSYSLCFPKPKSVVFSILYPEDRKSKPVYLSKPKSILLKEFYNPQSPSCQKEPQTTNRPQKHWVHSPWPRKGAASRRSRRSLLSWSSVTWKGQTRGWR